MSNVSSVFTKNFLILSKYLVMIWKVIGWNKTSDYDDIIIENNDDMIVDKTKIVTFVVFNKNFMSPL